MGQPTQQAELWESELARLRRTTGVGMVFGGPVMASHLHLDHFDGAISGALCGLNVRSGFGLGGKVVREARLVAVDDYASSTTISHDFDIPVGSEGLRTVIGAPVVLGRTVCGVVYAGTRGHASAGDRLRGSAELAARRLAAELAAENEIERRVARRLGQATKSDGEAVETLRFLAAELRALRADATDPEWTEKLDRLSGIADGWPVGQANGADSDTPVVSPRQRDVLTMVATGEPYSVIAVRLGLSAATVKSYMRDLNRLLGVHGRHAAVTEARRRGMIR